MGSEPWVTWQDHALRHPLASAPGPDLTHLVPINNGELLAVVILAVDR